VYLILNHSFLILLSACYAMLCWVGRLQRTCWVWSSLRGSPHPPSRSASPPRARSAQLPPVRRGQAAAGCACSTLSIYVCLNSGCLRLPRLFCAALILRTLIFIPGYNWRMLTLLSAIPTFFFTALAMCTLDESPRCESSFLAGVLRVCESLSCGSGQVSVLLMYCVALPGVLISQGEAAAKALLRKVADCTTSSLGATRQCIYSIREAGVSAACTELTISPSCPNSPVPAGEISPRTQPTGQTVHEYM
jgi:hypothetical protein